MKFALVNGECLEAQAGLSGTCPVCGDPMVAKCGKIKVRHWAHRTRRVCDPWWENETEWHRAWKNEFPSSWQEVVHRAANGERHIADVKTDAGWVIELQHSHIRAEERLSRNAFYRHLVWVVDGTRRKKDRLRLLEAVKTGLPVDAEFLICRIMFPDECPLLRDWGDTRAPVFFDFGGSPWLWCFLGRQPSGHVYVAPFLRAAFIEIHRNSTADKAPNFHTLVRELGNRIRNYEEVKAPKRQAIIQTIKRSPNTLPPRRRRKRL